MAPAEYTDYVAELRSADGYLADAFASYESVEHVLGWMKQQGLPPGSVDMVAQDEFHYDFLIHLLDGRWLVFGVN
jgi:hypothetical protein